jgi:hypothetical protein
LRVVEGRAQGELEKSLKESELTKLRRDRPSELLEDGKEKSQVQVE